MSYSYDNENRLVVQLDPDGSKTTLACRTTVHRATGTNPSLSGFLASKT
jgi:hypothetical protein